MSEQAALYYGAAVVSSKMNKEKSTVDTIGVILRGVASKKQRTFADLLEWIQRERGLSVNHIAEQSGKFSRSAITEQKKKKEPNPGLTIIHELARFADIPEQMVVDACLGRPFLKGRDLDEARVKELFRKYQMIEDENRTESLETTLTILTSIVDEILESQSADNTRH